VWRQLQRLSRLFPGDRSRFVGDLALRGAELRFFGDRLERVQEHGLADAAQGTPSVIGTPR
jgi:hypothetical protein